ncbi:MAG: N-acetyl-D-Glu racemase DgcA [Pseudomonadota bacterium]
MPCALAVEAQSWPIEGTFVISRGARREAKVLVVELTAGTVRGRGECVPYPRYGESLESVTAQIETLRPKLEAGLTRLELRSALAPGAARNAVDCALWDLQAKTAGTKLVDVFWQGKLADGGLTTAYTISLGEPEEMAERAAWAKDFPLLKLKLGGDGDAERMAAVRAARPDARISVDANEAWRPDAFDALMAAAVAAGIELVEQPLPAGDDAALETAGRPVTICADEAMHTADDIDVLANRYGAVNVKLDKTGGLTGAIDALLAADEAGMQTMVGCMVGTSLAMAPAALLAPFCHWVDLDGPLLLANDRSAAINYDGALMSAPRPELWG